MSVITDHRIYAVGTNAELLQFAKTFILRLSTVVEAARRIIPKRTDDDTIIDVEIEDGTSVRIDVPVYVRADRDANYPHLRQLGSYDGMFHVFETPTRYLISLLSNKYTLEGEVDVLSQLYPNLTFEHYFDYEQGEFHRFELYKAGEHYEGIEMEIIRKSVVEEHPDKPFDTFTIWHGCDPSHPSDQLVVQIVGLDGLYA